MTEPRIRLAEEADLPAIVALRRRWTKEQAGGRIDDDGFEERFTAWHARERDRRRTWLAEVDGVPVGMVNLAIFTRMPRPGREPSAWGYLANAFVLHAYRNAGIGARLVDSVLAYARRHGLVRVVLSPSERSVPFYVRAGFGPADMLLATTLR